jgi:hypothetical protein
VGEGCRGNNHILQRGHAEEARSAYAEVAKERDYYGFLASDRINAAYTLDITPVRPEARELNGIKALPGIQRAQEFEQLGMSAELWQGNVCREVIDWYPEILKMAIPK